MKFPFLTEGYKYYWCALITLLFSWIVVFIAIQYGGEYFLHGNKCTSHYFGYPEFFSKWDGQWYALIVDRGYNYYDAGGYSPHVFFPLYPLLGVFVKFITGLGSTLSLFAVTCVSGVLFCLSWVRYVKNHGACNSSNMGHLALGLIMFWPTSEFLHFNYTEALYVLLLSLFFIGMSEKWKIPWLIFLCGLITATRPTGIVCSIVIAIHAWRRADEKNNAIKLFISVAVGLASAWGLYLYMGFLELEYHNAFLFIERQSAWNYGKPDDQFIQQWREMLTLKPIWGFMFDGSLFNMETYAWNLPNKFLWLFSLFILCIGGIKKWLSAEEIAFCLISLLLFYYTKGVHNMESVGRYTLTLLPLFVVMARLLDKCSKETQTGILILLGCLFFIQTALYSQMYCVF